MNDKYALPNAVQIVIIGGGIIGSSTALELAERGISVALLEKGDIAGEQSSRNWGWVRCMGRDNREFPLAIRSRELWKEMSTRTDSEVGYRQLGITYVASNEQEIEKFKNMQTEMREYGIDSKLLNNQQLEKHLPLKSGRYIGGLYCPGDGCAEPSLATNAIAEQARKLGAQIITQTAARALDTSAGLLTGVHTEKGLIRCETVLIAAGAWTRLFLGNHKIDFPQLLVRGSVARIQHAKKTPDFIIGGRDFAIRKRQDGEYTIAIRNSNDVFLTKDIFTQAMRYIKQLPSYWPDINFHLDNHFIEDFRIPRRWCIDEITPFEINRTNTKSFSTHYPAKALDKIIKALPNFQGAIITHGWSGWMDVTPKAIPIISPIKKISGAFVASGFSGHGFGIGPAAGQIIAEMLLEKKTYTDINPFQM